MRFSCQFLPSPLTQPCSLRTDIAPTTSTLIQSTKPRQETYKTSNPYESYYLKTLKSTMNRVVSHNYDIFVDCNDFTEDLVSIPTVQLIPPKKIGINYCFHLKDQQACEFLVRSAITYYEWTQSHPINNLLTLSTTQVAIGFFAHYKNLSFLKTVALTSLINIPLLLLFAHSQPKKWHSKILQQNTDQELLGGRRFFHVLLHNCKDRHKRIIPTLKSYIQEINQLIKARGIHFNPQEEQRRENVLDEYLKPFHNRIMQLEFIPSKTK